jgi:hypothetical protein
LPPQNGGDLQLYQHIVERVHSGESYYRAAGDELRSLGYPTGSFFNWRPPTYAWFLGSLPSARWGQLILIALAVATVLMVYGLLRVEAGITGAVLGVSAALGSLLWCIDGDAFFSQELWSGTLIAFSVCAYGRGCKGLGVVAGLCALFFRELALPYCVISLALAWHGGRRLETAAWLGGLVLYAGFMAFHLVQVGRQVGPEDHLPGSWIQFGGAGFVLATCRMNEFLFRLPLWVSALYLPLAVLGLAGWRSELGSRVTLTVAAYLAAFCVVGQPFNMYWGLLYAPLVALGLAYTPAVLRDLLCRLLPGALAAANNGPVAVQ